MIKFSKYFLLWICLAIFGMPALAGIPGSITIPTLVQTDYCLVDIGPPDAVPFNTVLGATTDNNKHALEIMLADGGYTAPAADPIDPGSILVSMATNPGPEPDTPACMAFCNDKSHTHFISAWTARYLARLAAIPLPPKPVA